jgi:hypothetical protein
MTEAAPVRSVRVGWLRLVGGAAMTLVATAARVAEHPISAYAIGIGVSGPADTGIGMLEIRGSLTPNLYLSFAPTLLHTEGSATVRQLRTGGTLHFNAGPLLIEDRNMWLFSDPGPTRYRNRLRLTIPVPAGHRTLRLYAYNEVTYEYGGRGWARNLLATGIGINPVPSLSVDLYAASQKDEGRSAFGLLIVVASLRLR